MTKYVALIPAYEPDEQMLALLPRIVEAGFDAVVVDDGSGEDYAHLFAKAEEFAKVISYTPNMGKGYAMKKGFEYIWEHYGESCAVVTVDADGQHRVEDAARLCQKAEECTDTLVIGARKFTGDVPRRSRFGNDVTRFVYRVCSGVKLYDTQTGLRAFSGKMLPVMLEISGNRYEYEMRMLLELAHEKTPMVEIEIPTIYINDNAASHFNPAKDSWRIYKEIFKLLLSPKKKAPKSHK